MDLRASKSARPGIYATNATCDGLLALIENWWPSNFGMVAGVSLAPDTSSEVSSGIAERGQLRAAELSSVTQCFETTTSYDNLGFVLLTRGEDWASVSDELDARGWSDGQPVDFILDRLP